MRRKMAKEVVLALDQGSSSSRVLAIDSRGKVVARAQFPIKTLFPKEGFIEHDAEDLAASQERALDAVLEKLPPSARVLGMGVAAQRSTVVFWDRETGKPAARAPSWQDGRAASVVAPLLGRQSEVHEKTGLYLTPYYSAPKIRWFLDHDDSLRRLADAGRLAVGPVSAYLIWRLTQGESFVTDPSMAQRMLLLDIRSMEWDDGMLSMFGVPKGILPEVVASAGPLGLVKRQGREIQVLAMLGDQQSAAVGLGAMEDGSSVLNYGTGAFFLHNTGAKLHRIPGLLTSVGWRVEGQAPVYLEEGTVHAAGTSFDWLSANLGLFKRKTEISRLCGQSKNRVWALPALGGLGAPRWDFGAKVAFAGLSTQTRKEDLVRAMAEGLAFLIADIVLTLRAAGLSPSGAKVSGGLSRLDHLLAFQSDILGMRLERCREREATALGVASLTAQAAGASWAPVLRRPAVERAFEPSMSREEAAKLLASWQRFVEAQTKLSRELSA
ncbi:MAG: glycerol kinase [Elusimicrobia bacterium]|nr:glycerol kinase [Elusimicrobiota bacterium]